MPGHEKGIYWHVALHREAAFGRLFGFLRKIAHRHIAPRNRCKPFFCESYGIVPRNITGNGQYGIVGCIKAEEEASYLVERSIGYVREFLADGRPLIGMHFVSQRTQQMSHITIRLVEATLFELFHHHSALHLKVLLAEGQFEHAVRLKPEGRLYIRTGNGKIIVGNVVVGPGIVFTTCLLQRSIIVGDVCRAPEHEVLEQVCKARM